MVLILFLNVVNKDTGLEFHTISRSGSLSNSLANGGNNLFNHYAKKARTNCIGYTLPMFKIVR